MPKNKVNNNIKLKSGGGVINDATDGLSVDTGTTDGKIVAMTTGDKLPAVDGSNLTNLPIQWVEQNIGITICGLAALTLNHIDFCFSSDKTMFYIIGSASSDDTYKIFRFLQDNTGKYYFSNTISVAYVSTRACGITFYNNYVYIIVKPGGTQTMKRYNSDLTDETSITISGGSTNEVSGLANDGATFYTLNISNTTGGYYTLSGTTLTRGGDISAITGAFASYGERIKSLASTNDKLVFTWNNSSSCDTLSDITGIKAATIAQSGGAATENSITNNSDNWILGLIPYGDGDTATEFVIISSKGELFGTLYLTRVSKSKLGI